MFTFAGEKLEAARNGFGKGGAGAGRGIRGSEESGIQAGAFRVRYGGREYKMGRRNKWAALGIVNGGKRGFFGRNLMYQV